MLVMIELGGIGSDAKVMVGARSGERQMRIEPAMYLLSR